MRKKKGAQNPKNIPFSYLSVTLETPGVGAADDEANFAKAFLFAFSICVVSMKAKLDQLEMAWEQWNTF